MVAEQDFDAALRAERDAYLRELRADLDNVENLILKLPPEDASGERERKLARDIHSIKGAAGSYGLELISLEVHRLEDDLAMLELTDNADNKYVDRLLKHKDRLLQLVEAYLGEDNQTLADFQLMYARRAVAPATTPEDSPGLLFRVLLVDTSRATLKACVAALHEAGVQEIASVQDGYDALGRLLREPFYAVITSLYVPTIGGQALMPVLRAIPGPNQTTPVILLTSSAADLDPTAAWPDHIVEKNPQMAKRLKKILSSLNGASVLDAPPARPKIDRGLKKIVLVDDSPAIHQLLRISFKRFPEIQIAALEDPTTAVEFVRREQPDLVLLDMNMPQASGREVIRDIKADADLESIPVAFLTADSSANDRDELIGLGASHVFKKPFLPKTFADELIRAYNEL